MLHLRRAILDRRSVRFRYTARNPSERQPPAYREIDPYALIHLAGSWHVSGYDHLRHDPRTFRLDRIEELPRSTAPSSAPRSFAPLQRSRDEGRDLIVRALFDRETARWVRESRSFFTVAEEETADGLLVTLAMRREARSAAMAARLGEPCARARTGVLAGAHRGGSGRTFGASFRFPFATDIMLSHAGGIVWMKAATIGVAAGIPLRRSPR